MYRLGLEPAVVTPYSVCRPFVVHRSRLQTTFGADRALFSSWIDGYLFAIAGDGISHLLEGMVRLTTSHFESANVKRQTTFLKM